VSLASAQAAGSSDERSATEGPEHGWDALVERVRIALTGMAESAGVSAKVQAELRGLAPPTTKMRTNLLRIAQEAVTQTIRVAEPRSIEVMLKRGDGGIVFELTDDGSLGQEARQRRSLAPLRGRVAAMGGTAEIRRGEHGWVTRVKLPADQLN
jgi:signal transduction histidine kinase